MPSVQNKTFEEITVGDAASNSAYVASGRRASLGRRLRRRRHARRPGREPGGCRHRHGHADRVGRFSPSGTREFDPRGLGANQRRAAHRHRDDSAARRAGEAARPGDRRAGRPMYRRGGSGRRDCDPGSSRAYDAAATPDRGASARKADRALSESQTDADGRRASM